MSASMNWSSNRPLSGDSVRLDVPGGWAWIVPEVLQTPADTMDNFRFIIRSTGYATDPSQGSTSLATHTVAQFADWQTPWLSVPSAALIAANGVQAIARNGPIRITGIDLACGATIPAIAGVRVPADPMYLDVAAATVTRTPAGPPTRLNSLQGPPSLRTQLNGPQIRVCKSRKPRAVQLLLHPAGPQL